MQVFKEMQYVTQAIHTWSAEVTCSLASSMSFWYYACSSFISLSYLHAPLSFHVQPHILFLHHLLLPSQSNSWSRLSRQSMSRDLSSSCLTVSTTQPTSTSTCGGVSSCSLLMPTPSRREAQSSWLRCELCRGASFRSSWTLGKCECLGVWRGLEKVQDGACGSGVWRLGIWRRYGMVWGSKIWERYIW